jgi:hypothetical protein
MLDRCSVPLLQVMTLASFMNGVSWVSASTTSPIPSVLALSTSIRFQ